MNRQKHKLSRRILAVLLMAAMLITMLPSAMFAQDGQEPASRQTGNIVTPSVEESSGDGLTLKKSIAQNDEGGYDLTLEAFASNQLTTTPKDVEIVLVLDTSGSMGDDLAGSYVETSRTQWSYNDVANSSTQYYYKDSNGDYHKVRGNYDQGWSGPKSDYRLEYGSWFNWTQFAGPSDSPRAVIYEGPLYTHDKMSAMKNAVNDFIDSVADEENADHYKIGIISFAGSAETKAGLTTVNAKGVETLKNAVNGLSANGATGVDYGLSAAQKMLGLNETVDENDPSKVVVVFTDGEPNHQSGFNNRVAASAVNTAGDMKAKGASVYTIGMFDGADPNDTDKNSISI